MIDKYKFHHPNDGYLNDLFNKVESKKKKKNKKKKSSDVFNSLMIRLTEVKAHTMIEERNKMILELSDQLSKYELVESVEIIKRAKELASKDFGLKKTTISKEE